MVGNLDAGNYCSMYLAKIVLILLIKGEESMERHVEANYSTFDKSISGPKVFFFFFCSKDTG